MSNLTKEECIESLEIVSFAYGYLTLKEVLEDTKVGSVPFRVLNMLITEHFDNPPLEFEELKIGIPYWNNKEKLWCFFTTLNKDIKTGVKITIEDIPMSCAFKFENNHFYAKEVKDDVD